LHSEAFWDPQKLHKIAAITLFAWALEPQNINAKNGFMMTLPFALAFHKLGVDILDDGSGQEMMMMIIIITTTGSR
jgi:hypothetical protein